MGTLVDGWPNFEKNWPNICQENVLWLVELTLKKIGYLSWCVSSSTTHLWVLSMHIYMYS